ncbi:hypothetical protein EJ06DRAFT_555187 [Trichodelitschia bisporula]|uniref:C2H2-type domain-containing protein n=1 Tax=Trichodelitschia bisporula TaxID=703511 RepID=A0A6G1I374_9PEZI|nr:hypothetical protein EJ06DRAFT_555187 [Trichodelitschia bisporula]
MLSTATSSIEQRRKAHRRQNSTPQLEAPNVRPVPALQRTAGSVSPRRNAHRRGLSLDQHTGFRRPDPLAPTLGPITQDDSTHPLQVAQQHRLATPGHEFQHHQHNHQFQHEIQQSQFDPRLDHDQHRHQHMHEQSSPTLSVQTSHLQPAMQAFPGPFDFKEEDFLPSPTTPRASRLTASPQLSQGPQFAPPPPNHLSGRCEEALQKLKESIDSVYGPGNNVFINILPTPVATPQKRPSASQPPKLDVAPIPLDFPDSLSLEPPGSTAFDFDETPSLSHYSPTAMSPQHSQHSHHSAHQHPSPYLSPHAHPISSFDSYDQQPTPHLSFSSAPHLSSQTTLADVEDLFSDGLSPSLSPRPISIADLSLDAAYEATLADTGVAPEEVAALISHDVSSNTFTCLFPTCNKRGFQRRENVRSHVQTHLGDRQFKCPHCGKTFVRPHDLKRHAKIHSGQKPYRCPCGQDFVRQDALTRHRQRGSCVGAFPGARENKPTARRGRPRKKRPDMDSRVDKAARARARDAEARFRGESSGSSGEDSPSPGPEDGGLDFGALDTARLVDLDAAGGSVTSEHFSFDNTSPLDYSSPFDPDATDLIFQLSQAAAAGGAPTPPESPPAEGGAVGGTEGGMDALGLVVGGDDVFLGAEGDLLREGGFWGM